MVPPKLDHYAFAGVFHIARQAHFMRQPPDRRAKAYALNLTRNGEAGTGHVAASQIRMRLLPLSATATVEPRADSP